MLCEDRADAQDIIATTSAPKNSSIFLENSDQYGRLEDLMFSFWLASEMGRGSMEEPGRLCADLLSSGV